MPDTRSKGQKFRDTLLRQGTGEVPIWGGFSMATWIRYGVVFYLYALIFVAFAVDVLFLFPVALTALTQTFPEFLRNTPDPVQLID